VRFGYSKGEAVTERMKKENKKKVEKSRASCAVMAESGPEARTTSAVSSEDLLY
jgi:hypothetical protein